MKHTITAEERMIDELIYLCKIEHEKGFTHTELRELLKQNILNSIIPLSVIDKIQAEAEKGCRKLYAINRDVCGKGRNIFVGEKEVIEYCIKCQSIIAICKKIKGETK